MITRRLFITLFFISLVPLFPAFAETVQPVEQKKSEKVKLLQPGSLPKRPAPVMELNLRDPFVLKTGFEALPSGKPEMVQVFDGMAAFKRDADGKYAAWSIAWYSVDVIPKNDQEVRAALAAHAARLGADIVVVLRSPEEISRYMNAPDLENFVFCALAYRRVHAQLGIEIAKEKNQTKVRGFKKVSQAADSGIKAGDIIKTVDGAPLDGTATYWQKAVRWKAGDKINVVVERDGQPMEFQVELIAS